MSENFNRLLNFVSWAFVILFLPILISRLTWARQKTEPAFVMVIMTASTMFVMWHVPIYILIMLTSIGVDYLAALAIHRCPDASRKRKWLLFASLATNLTLLAMSCVGFVANRLPPLKDHPPLVVQAKDPPTADWYLSYSRGSVEDYVIYDNLDSVATQLKAADVLFLGNSRMRQAVGPENVSLLDDFFKSRHLRYYMLAFGHGETSPFPQAIIQKYDLHPRWVIINVDPFFSEVPSAFARKVMSGTRFDALKFRFETEVSFKVRRQLHRYVPYLALFPWIENDRIFYRSTLNGVAMLAGYVPKDSLFTPRTPTDMPATMGPLSYGATFDPSQIPTALRFKEDMDRRGASLVFTSIPPSSAASAKQFAELLQVPLLSPAVTDLTTFDGSHLTAGSARRYTAALLEDLAKVMDGHPRQGTDQMSEKLTHR